MLVIGDVNQQSLGKQSDVRDGFLPRLSPDGSRLAYLQRATATRARVLVTTRDTGETVTLSESGTLASHITSFPVVFSDQPLAWSPSGDALYFVERQDASYRIRRQVVSPDGLKGLVTLVTTPDRISDLQVSPNGQQIAYLSGRAANAERTAASERVYELHVFDVASSRDDVWAAFPAGNKTTCRGWTPDGRSVVIARTAKIHDDATHTLEVLLASASHQVRVLATIDHVVQETLRVPAWKPVLYMTRSEGGVANLYALALDTRILTPITDNALVDVTFGSVELFGSDRLAGVRDVRKHDIWLLDARSAQAGTPASGSR